MKKQILIVSCILLMLSLIQFSCTNFNKDKNAIDSDAMKGKYELDLTPLIASLVKDEGALVGLVLSSIKANVSFYENNRGVLELNGKIVDLTAIFSDEPIDKIHQFGYKIENDSVFYLKKNEKEGFKQRAIVRKLGDNYEYLEFSFILEERDDISLNLVKIGE
ncbi:MAG: hypothetical protein GX857_08455 [Bacteroidales bacterium]|nr:hypothetical protein [Bacteroidales bacterium]